MFFILSQAPATVYCKKKPDLGQEVCPFFCLRLKIDVHEFLNNIEEVRIQLQYINIKQYEKIYTILKWHVSSNNRLKEKFSPSEILNKKVYWDWEQCLPRATRNKKHLQMYSLWERILNWHPDGVS